MTMVLVSLYLGLSAASTLLGWVWRLRDGEMRKAEAAIWLGAVFWLAAAIQAGPMTGWWSLWLAAGYGAAVALGMVWTGRMRRRWWGE
jgi:hypothetical protein